MASRLGTGAVVVALAAALLPGLSTPSGAAGAADGPGAVVETRVLGTSVKGRKIYAYRVGNPKARVRAVAMSTMHGDEPRTRQILRSVVEGRKVRGLDLWVIPTVNPDGLARGTRKNAHGVDLNRNFPRRWTDLDGRYESGPRPASEPETRALVRFFSEIRPRYVVSYHQPLHGVDVSTPGSRAFGKRLARAFHLPRKWLTCNGGCHGTFTQWYNHRFGRKPAVTVEYGHRPSRHRMRVRAPRQLVRALGGHY
jgi:murein peptide amidase A